MPCACSRSSTSSSQPKSRSPGDGSRRAQLKTPTRHEVDARAHHELGILAPDLARPLLGVVVAAEADAALAGERRERVDAARVQRGDDGEPLLISSWTLVGSKLRLSKRFNTETIY